MQTEEKSSGLEHLAKNAFARVGTLVTGITALATALHQLTGDIILTLEGLVLAIVIIASAIVILWRSSKVVDGRKVHVPFADIQRLIAGAALVVAVVLAIPYTLLLTNLVLQREQAEKQLAVIPFLALTPSPTATSTATPPPGAPQTTAAQSVATTVARATATTQAGIAYAEALAQSGEKAYGPAEGILELARADVATCFRSGVFLRNLVAEAQFFNPADGKVNPWDYGINFRSVGFNQQYWLNINWDGSWDLVYPKLNPDGSIQTNVSYSRGTVRNWDASPSGSNHLRVVVDDQLGYFFVNNEFVSTLNVSQKNEQGNVSICTSFFAAHRFPGLAVRYKDFTVYSLP